MREERSKVKKRNLYVVSLQRTQSKTKPSKKKNLWNIAKKSALTQNFDQTRQHACIHTQFYY